DFAQASYSLSSYQSPGGTLTPTTTVAFGGSQTFTATPNAGYVVKRVRIDGIDQVGPFTDPYNYTFSNVMATHVIAVDFAPGSYAITSYQSPGGTLTPTTTVAFGGSQTFTATPNAGYVVKRVRIDGIDQVGPFTDPYNYT